ncbi:hypothetical protein PCANC_11599 [Puccinia coronata f. sp. avenae]|uniref:Uncharacterized protein n=1 Tax=Puccinia coronata f. sp. avenae TaxID=200324 RepID=A0A2N5UIK9_9BASI|nr:hypothetical protein PCANC_24136 [Puccinia coronata f. sp. avenae]PLW37527.1 hypothetical protein PCASD_10270 [Puccinia coronata f. sp. avenae]PLW46060.1 hypothetical protein PCANC_11599 [Puccinia coronata f. sp. avenae]
MAAFRDANLLIVSLSTHAHSVHVGLGVSPEVIQLPSITLPTIAYIKPELAQSNVPRKWSDYSFEPQLDRVPIPLFSTQSHHGSQLSQQCPLVTDWKGLDALFRHLLFNRLKLSKPPVAQHILLSIPPNLPNSTRDKFTQLFFENLQAPALFLGESPLLQILACSCTSGITIDIGARSTLIGFVSDSILLDQSCHFYPIGEQDCDDYLISLLLNENPDLPTQLGWTATNPPEKLYHALLGFVSNLKADGHIRFEPQLNTLAVSVTDLRSSEEEETGITDVAQAIVSGKADKIIGRQTSNNSSHNARRSTQTGKLLAEIQKDTDTIIVSNPHNSQQSVNPSAPPSPLLDCQSSQAIPLPAEALSLPREQAGIRISKSRHRHAEPFFAPKLLRSIGPVFSRFGLEKYAARYNEELTAEDDSLVESIHRGISKLISSEQRKDVVGQFVLTDGSGLMCRTEGLGIAISAELQSRNSGLNSLMQITNQGDGIFKPMRVPEYFSEFKGKPEYLGFLGGCIVAKLVFNDASSTKLWMSKPDYNKEGPYTCRELFGVHSSS